MDSNPFPAGPRDPLLLSVRIIIICLMVVMGIAIGALAIGAPAVLFNQAEVLGELAKEGYTGDPARVIWGIAGVCLLAILPLALIFEFLRTLNAVIDTVADGQPFAAANAARLGRMAWLSLAVQAAAIPVGTLGFWLGQQFEKGKADVDIDIGFSGSGVMMALVLFILARVFRHGAAMREELEGTV